MAVELGKKVNKGIVKASELKDGQIAEIVSGEHIGELAMRYYSNIVNIGKSGGQGWSRLPTFEVRILEVGETITANDGI